MKKEKMQTLSLYLPSDLVREVKEESQSEQVSLSELVKQKLIYLKTFKREKSFYESILQKLENLENNNIKNDGSGLGELNKELILYLAEITYLLREILSNSDEKIFKAANEKLSQKYGKDRKKL